MCLILNTNFLHTISIETLVELSLHKMALRPVASHLYFSIHAYRTDDGSFKRLQSNMRLLEKKGMEELGGSAGVGIPDSTTLERIQQKWTSMHEAYSPNKKVQIMLKVCKTIYNSMTTNGTSGKQVYFFMIILVTLCPPSLCDIHIYILISCPAGTVFGADDFLPCLTWVLLRCDVVTLQLDTDYMMELLDPTQLQGEGKADAVRRILVDWLAD